MENKTTFNKDTSGGNNNLGADDGFLIDQVKNFFELPVKAWYRLVFLEFAANISMIGIALSALFFALILGCSGLLESRGGLSTLFASISWIDLVALKRIDEMLAGSLGKVISIIGLVVTVIGSFGLLRVIESVFDQQWGKIYLHNLAQRLPIYWMVLCIVPALLFFSVASSAYYMIDPEGQLSAGSLKLFWKGAQFVATFIAFGFLYKVLNGPTVSWRSSFSGGFWATVGFEFVKHILLLTVNPIGGSFSHPIISFLLLSMLLCVGFVLCSGALIFGNTIAYVDQHRFILEEMEIPHQKSEPRPTREIALAALLEMTRRFYIKGGGADPTLGLDPVDVARIARTTPQRGKHVIKLLESVGLVKIIQDGPRETSILKVHPENLSLDEFLGRLEQRVHSKALNVPTMLPDASNQWFWQEYEKALRDRFGSLSLKDLAEMSMIMKKNSQAS